MQTSDSTQTLIPILVLVLILTRRQQMIQQQATDNRMEQNVILTRMARGLILIRCSQQGRGESLFQCYVKDK
jgi:hypothetical protein